MFPCGAGLDLEELVEGQDAGLATFPACSKFGQSNDARDWQTGLSAGECEPFWPSWKIGGPGW